MIWIMKDDLKDIISKYMEKGNFEKPLMIVATSKFISSNAIVDECKSWLSDNFKIRHIDGHPLQQGNKYFVIDGKTERIKDYPELLNSVIIPAGADNAQLLLYHRYYEQLDPQHLNYVLALSMKLRKPAICLINDYSYAKHKDGEFNQELFDVCVYDGRI